MKKILAGVLAAASMLSVSATAFATANTKAVTKPGEVEYEVAVTAPPVVLNLVMPAKMAASLNPYGAEIKLDADGTNKSTKGIASLAYKVTNKSVDYGVYLDGTAITTITTTDKPVDGKPAWSVKGTSVTAGTKSACAGLIAVDTVADDPAPIASKAAASGAQGALLFDSTVEANKETGVVAGQTKQPKFAFIPAATKSGDTVTDAETYLIIAGDLAKSNSTKEVVWNEDDAINVQLVLKVVAGPKTLS